MTTTSFSKAPWYQGINTLIALLVISFVALVLFHNDSLVFSQTLLCVSAFTWFFAQGIAQSRHGMDNINVFTVVVGLSVTGLAGYILRDPREGVIQLLPTMAWAMIPALLLMVWCYRKPNDTACNNRILVGYILFALWTIALVVIKRYVTIPLYSGQVSSPIFIYTSLLVVSVIAHTEKDKVSSYVPAIMILLLASAYIRTFGFTLTPSLTLGYGLIFIFYVAIGLFVTLLLPGVVAKAAYAFLNPPKLTPRQIAAQEKAREEKREADERHREEIFKSHQAEAIRNIKEEIKKARMDRFKQW